MNVSIDTPSEQAAADVTQQEAAAARQPGFFKRMALIILLVILMYAGTYAYAWFQSYQLSSRFFEDAKTSYENGDYLMAMVGYEEFDPQTNSYINRGGYLNVLKIWSSSYSWPRPDQYEEARQNISQIINHDMTIEQAETYIRRNTGRRNVPFFAEIYFQLGILYEKEGDARSALEIYESIGSLFPTRDDLEQLAQERIAALEN
jgi:tetratricopeptide (TPR) repeat protein